MNLRDFGVLCIGPMACLFTGTSTYLPILAELWASLSVEKALYTYLWNSSNTKNLIMTTNKAFVRAHGFHLVDSGMF